MKAVAAFDGAYVQFAEAYNCKQHFQPQNRCVVTQPKAFTRAERVRVQALINDLSSPAASIFSKISHLKKPLTFFRHEFGKERVNSRSFKRDSLVYAWVQHDGQPHVHLTDLFFEATATINSNFQLQHYFLLHELSHLFDKNTGDPALSQDFLDFYGWEKVEFGEPYWIGGLEMKRERWQLASASVEEVLALRSLLNSLHAEGETQEAELISFNFGRRHGHPGSYSMTNPRENFAELLTSELIDPERMVDVPSEVRAWLRGLLLPEI